jgi:DNA repair protein RadC
MTTPVALEYEALHWSERSDGVWHASALGRMYEVRPHPGGGFRSWVAYEGRWFYLGQRGSLGGAFRLASEHAGGAKKAAEAHEGCSHAHPPEVPTTPCASENVPVIYEAGALKETPLVAEEQTGGLAVVERDVDKVRRGRKKGQLKTAKDIYTLVHPTLVTQNQEVIVVIPMDIHGRPLNDKPYEIARGQRDRVSVDPSDVLRPVVSTNAKGFVMCHNHPSGQGKASPADVDLTRRIHKAAKELDVVLVDHVVIGDGQYESIREAYGKKAGFAK